jgi:Cell wall-associated hydrolases (invasion-associated proteins)
VSFSSCGTSKAPNLNYTALAQASVKLNVKIDFEDNHDLYLEIAKWVGVPYRYGGNTKRGVDCSGFACSVYKTVYKKTLKRNSNEQMKQTSKVSRAKLQEGDLVFFSSSKSKKRASHVGIYLKDGKFIHSSSSGKGVMVSKLNEPYYKKYWIRGGRMN